MRYDRLKIIKIAPPTVEKVVHILQFIFATEHAIPKLNTAMQSPRDVDRHRYTVLSI